MIEQSPEYAKLSLAGAMTLGFREGRFWRNAKMTCINLLLHYPDGCKANCAYCGLSRGRIAEERTFIHVPWPIQSMDDIIDRLNRSTIARRTCISMITHRRANRDTLEMTRRLAGETRQPVSILMGPSTTDKAFLEALKEDGAEKIGIAIDAATPELFDKHRGRGVRGPHRWETYWQRFAEAVEVFGGPNVGSHFIVGLGEREEDLVRCFQRVRDLGGVNHLFSFFSEDGTTLGDIAQPPLDVYRRIQIACHIIDERLSSFDDFRFHPETGRIIHFGVAGDTLDKLIEDGEAFMTRGCKGCDGKVDCNRPFGNSFPGPEMRNFPFPPTKEDIRLIRTQIFSPSGKDKRIVFSVPNFKQYDTDAYSNRNHSNFPSFSITGTKCALHCDHCNAQLLHSMIPATTPDMLWEKACRGSKNGTTGVLVSGGCDKNGIVPLEPFSDVIRRIKQELQLEVAVHTKLVNESLASALATTGVDTVMIDMVSTRILQEIYHLGNKTTRDIERSLDLLEDHDLPASPHIILGLSSGKENSQSLDWEWEALEKLRSRSLKSVVIVFHMPLPQTKMRRPTFVPLREVNRYFAAAREVFCDVPLFLGCARPPGDYQVRLDTLALKHGFNGIAFPSDEVVEIARKRKYGIRFDETCCALL